MSISAFTNAFKKTKKINKILVNALWTNNDQLHFINQQFFIVDIVDNVD